MDPRSHSAKCPITWILFLDDIIRSRENGENLEDGSCWKERHTTHFGALVGNYKLENYTSEGFVNININCLKWSLCDLIGTSDRVTNSMWRFTSLLTVWHHQYTAEQLETQVCDT